MAKRSIRATPLKVKLWEDGPGSSKKLAADLGVNESTVSRWANGIRPKMADRKRIAKALKMKMEDLW